MALGSQQTVRGGREISVSQGLVARAGALPAIEYAGLISVGPGGWRAQTALRVGSCTCSKFAVLSRRAALPHQTGILSSGATTSSHPFQESDHRLEPDCTRARRQAQVLKADIRSATQTRVLYLLSKAARVSEPLSIRSP